MEKQVYRFAGRTVEINSLHSMVHKMCSEYRTEDEAELFVSICQSDIEEERERSEKRGLNGDGWNQQRRDAYLETLAVPQARGVSARIWSIAVPRFFRGSGRFWLHLCRTEWNGEIHPRPSLAGAAG